MPCTVLLMESGHGKESVMSNFNVVSICVLIVFAFFPEAIGVNLARVVEGYMSVVMGGF